MTKAFWSKSRVAVIGAGHWGTALAQLAAQNCTQVRLWGRNDEQVRGINATRANASVLPELILNPKIQAVSHLQRAFESGVSAVIWALPSDVTRDVAKDVSRYFSGEEIVLHAVKGIEEATLKRMSQVLVEELPVRRIGVISGPNLAAEIARGEPAGTVVASRFIEVIDAGQHLLATPSFRVYGSHDVTGVEWAGVLKNVLAIAAGSLDALGLGWNTRALLISRGLAEMVRLGTHLGAEPQTFLGLAGIGDLLATASSPLSRNYRVGYRLGKGESLEAILADLGSVAEGVRTTRILWEYARAKDMELPITAGVYALLMGRATAQQALAELMKRPPSME